ncbi:MAG: hypothetical protein QNI95_17010 [Desulfobacterales bacterium]|nr:hypothetical protein [Desulfobacterales bacterium]
MRFAHTNLVATNWKKRAHFYQRVFDCTPVPPERELAGEWLDRATGLSKANLRGIYIVKIKNGKKRMTYEEQASDKTVLQN